MELALVIWLISSLSSIAEMLGWSVFLSFGGFAAGVLMYFSSYDSSIGTETEALEWRKRGSSFMKLFIASFALCSVLFTLTPTTKTGWLIAGGYLTQTTLQSDMAKKFYSIVEIKLEEVLDEATKQAKIKAGSINEKKE